LIFGSAVRTAREMIGSLGEDATLRVDSHYDELDELYREIWGLHVHHGVWITGRESVGEATANLVRLIAQRARIEPGTRVTDVGCGYGETCRQLVRERGAIATGLTISRKQAEIARAMGDGPTFVVRDWLENTMPSRSADVVLAIESTEHMADFQKFFTVAARVLAPRGRLAIAAWLVADRPSRLSQRHLLAPMCEEGRMRMGTRADYVDAMRREGLVVEHFEDLSDRVSRTWSICIARALKKLATDARYRKYLFSRTSENRDFAKALLRIRAAYGLGAMRYGIFVASKGNCRMPT